MRFFDRNLFRVANTSYGGELCVYGFSLPDYLLSSTDSPSLIIYYPPDSQHHWGTEWNGIAAQAWPLPDTFTVEPLTYSRIGNTPNYAVADCDQNYSGSLSIPDFIEYDGTPYRIVAIGQEAFQNCSSLTEVIIPESVQSIGNYAFDECSSLAEVVIPESVTSIGEYAFWHCSSLIQITIPESVTSILEMVLSSFVLL